MRPWQPTTKRARSRKSRVRRSPCANGRFLHELAPRISGGLGLDVDAPLIAYARLRASQAGYSHLRFAAADARQLSQMLPFAPTTAVVSLCLHEMERETAVDTLRLQRAALHFDEWLARHYGRYLAYRDHGGMPALLSESEISIVQDVATSSASVRIWICEGNGLGARAE